ncbi:MAG: YbaK/EbsC family protein [Methyloligellaceae bacterium]
MTERKDASQKFSDAAARQGLAVEITNMAESTRTAEEAAAACGCQVAQIVKSLVFRGATSDAPYLLLVSGANRVNQKGVATAIGEALVRPDAGDVRALTGYAIGGIPPLGHAQPLKTYMDVDLLAHDRVWAAAGRPNSVFAADPERLASVTGAVVITVT